MISTAMAHIYEDDRIEVTPISEGCASIGLGEGLSVFLYSRSDTARIRAALDAVDEWLSQAAPVEKILGA